MTQKMLTLCEAEMTLLRVPDDDALMTGLEKALVVAVKSLLEQGKNLEKDLNE